MRHTKGPWVLDPQYLSEVQTTDLKTIATCWHEHADGAHITVRGVLPCSLEESAANARLISAAPTLLEALEGMLASAGWQNYSDDDLRHEISLGNEMVVSILAAREAIALAKGEQTNG